MKLKKAYPRVVCFALWIGLVYPVHAQVKFDADATAKKAQWVDSIYASFPLEKKVAQLYMAIAHTESNWSHIEKLVLQTGIGGVCFMQGNAAEQAYLMNTLQQKVKVPLWFSMDAEWGVGMRLPAVKNLPKALALGATNDSLLAFRYGERIGKQMKRMGLHINFAPVLDINSNPDNPVINYRSLGENKHRVAMLSAHVMMGMQEQDIIACAKHFPGHGNTNIDSHVSLPLIKQSKEAMEQTELQPYKVLIEQGLKGIMTAHLHIPSLEPNPSVPSSLSSAVVHDLLQKKLGYPGLVFTDGLNMASVTKLYSSATLDYKSFKAGNDVLLFSKNTDLGIDTICKAFRSGDISEERLAHSVKKILAAKYDAGLWRETRRDTLHIVDDLNDGISSLRSDVAQAAITCVRDNQDIIQRIRTQGLSSATVVALNLRETKFESDLKRLGVKEHIALNPINKQQVERDMQKIKQAGQVIVCVSGMLQSPSKQFGIDTVRLKLLQELSTLPNTMIVFFGNPYVLRHFCSIEGALICYDEEEETQAQALRVFTGEINPKGKLPLSVCEALKEGHYYKSSSWTVVEQ